MEFRILGPVSAQRDGRCVPLDGAKQRATFAALVIAHGRVVTDEALTDLLWGADPPASGTSRLYTYVSRLRTRLGPETGLTRQGTGYRLELGRATLDWETFRRLVEEGRAALRSGRYASAERSLAGALALWHGPALGGVTEQLAAAQGPCLEEARLAAVEHHIDAALALGRHEDLVPGLTGHVAGHPLRDRLRGQLMTALFRSGRRADALAVYDNGRRLLGEDLGIAPGPELHALHQSILTGTLPGPEAPERPTIAVRGPAAGDPEAAAGPARRVAAPRMPTGPATSVHRAVVTRRALTAPALSGAALHAAAPSMTHFAAAGPDDPAAAAHPTVDAGHPQAESTVPAASAAGAAAGRTPVPALLPAAAAVFIGRTDAARTATAALRDRRDVVITGPPGTGASSLALWIAERCRRDFPDGQLYADMRTAEGHPRGPHEVLGWFLRALGTEAERQPAGTDERAQLFRTLVAGRRMLIVLDNAADDLQVSPLMPGGGASRTVITGVHPALASLDAVRLVRLGPMASAEAVALLASAAGAERLAAEPEAALRVAEFCDRLPLALRIAGARLAARPHWSVARLADRLSVEARRLAELRIGCLDVTRGMCLALELLPEGAVTALHALASADLGCFTAAHAATLLGHGPDDAEELLEQLVDTQLLHVRPEDVTTPDGHACYRLPSLVRLYARRHRQAWATVSPLPPARVG
ncbi:transcriptional regulator [Streptomyces sp. tea 10]|nr:transcriptional regulator [Streptomyces sp. tea 10]